jgi:hypothetical protein
LVDTTKNQTKTEETKCDKYISVKEKQQDNQYSTKGRKTTTEAILRKDMNR